MELVAGRCGDDDQLAFEDSELLRHSPPQLKIQKEILLAEFRAFTGVGWLFHLCCLKKWLRGIECRCKAARVSAGSRHKKGLAATLANASEGHAAFHAMA